VVICRRGRGTRKHARQHSRHGESVPPMTSLTGDVIHPSRQAPPGQSSAVLLAAASGCHQTMAGDWLSCMCLRYVTARSLQPQHAIIHNCRQIRFLPRRCRYWF